MRGLLALSPFARRNSVRRPQPTPRSARPGVEQLELRALPSASVFPRVLPAASIPADLAALKADVQQLLKDVAQNPSPTLTADFKALSTDVTTFVSDVVAGRSLTADLSKLQADGTKLFNDLKASPSPAIQLDLTHIEHDVQTLVTDLKNNATNELKAAQTDLATLKQELGTNVSSTVSGELQALNTDLTAIAADIQASKSTTADAEKALTDEYTLYQSLAKPVSLNVGHTLIDLAVNLVELAV